jgi:hypothetical protein
MRKKERQNEAKPLGSIGHLELGQEYSVRLVLISLAL